MREEPIHVFGHVTPASPEHFALLQSFLASWNLEAECDLCGDLLRIDFIGVYFPHGELLDTLSPDFSCNTEGRIDIIDREAWTLTRYSITRGTVRVHTVPLNHVLSHSGF